MTDTEQSPMRLSKGRLLAWKQCPKRLYLEVHQPDLATVDEQAEYWFAMGREVGRVARDLCPEGILIDGAGARESLEKNKEGEGPGTREKENGEGTRVVAGKGKEKEKIPDLEAALSQTRALLSVSGCPPLFEATFRYDGVLIRADILVPVATGLVLREVKSAARVKDTHLDDCAIQAWVMEKAGYAPWKVELAHVDTSFEYTETDNYTGLIACQDITDPVSAIRQDVPGWVDGARLTLQGTIPAIEPGLQCHEPHDCPFLDHCWQRVPDYPLSVLPEQGKVIDELLAQGIDDVRDIPAGALTKPLQKRVREATISGRPFLDPKAGEALRALPYPRFYLDFETIQFAVPIWLNTHPYEQLPFQWSCHIERQPGEIEHADFLDASGKPPMGAFTEQLLTTLGGHGPIFIYSNYERRIIKEQARRFPHLSEHLLAFLDRLVDLQKIAKQHYYHPAMKGSWSIKAVLPTVAPELDYSQLEEIQNGTGAQMAFKECIAAGTSEARRQGLVKGLREYCGMDTLAMVKLVSFFCKEETGQV